jgi:hypothetical protein
MILGADFFRDPPPSNRNKNVTIAAAATFFLDFGATTFFSYFYQNVGNPLGNSWKFSGIPRNSREFPEILGNPPIFKIFP